jgi:hypothetical protein
MTTHQLASLLEHLQLGFGDNLKSGTGFAEAVVAIREMPDQPLKELAKNLRKPNAPSPAKRSNGSASVDVPAMIERIRAVRTGASDGVETIDPSRWTLPQLKDVLRAFEQPLNGTKATLITRVLQLCAHVDRNNGPSPAVEAGIELDGSAVEEGVRVYTALRDDRRLSISDVRAGFERLRCYSKPVIEEISRRLQYTPHGTRTEILDRLLANLEGIKVSQYKMDQILTGT